jgi:hypothetical protein
MCFEIWSLHNTKIRHNLAPFNDDFVMFLTVFCYCKTIWFPFNSGNSINNRTIQSITDQSSIHPSVDTPARMRIQTFKILGKIYATVREVAIKVWSCIFSPKFACEDTSVHLQRYFQRDFVVVIEKAPNLLWAGHERNDHLRSSGKMAFCDMVRP